MSLPSWLEVVNSVVRVVSENLPIVLSTVGLGSAVGVVPRLGPGRACSLAVRSLFTKAPVQSARHDDIAQLRRLFYQARHDSSAYFVVTGPKGVGKTALVETVLQRSPGVVSIDVRPGMRVDEITFAAYLAIGNISTGFAIGNPLFSVRRVLRWYRLFGLLKNARPTVLLRVAERSSDTPYAQVAAAARILAREGVRPVVDASTNSLEEEALRTLRQVVLDVESMSFDIVNSIDDFQKMFERLRFEGLEQVVWVVVGGVPANLNRLQRTLSPEMESDILRTTVHSFLVKELSHAIHLVNATRLVCPDIQQLLDRFKHQDEVPESIQLELGIARPSPDKVLRLVLRDGVPVLVPTAPAIAFVLRHGIDKVPSLDKLCQLAATTSGENC